MRGQTTSIEYMGGSKLPPGDSIRIEAGGGGICSLAAAVIVSLVLESPLSVRPGRASLGIANFIGELGIPAESGTKDEAEDLSDLMLVREVRIDGSELAEDAAGESRPASGEEMYDCGVCVSSTANLGEAGTPRSETAVLVARGIGIGDGISDMGVTGMAGPGVGGGIGGWSFSEGRVVLIVKLKEAPLSGMPLADMSPPCSCASCWEMTRPRPVPPCCRVLEPSI